MSLTTAYPSGFYSSAARENKTQVNASKCPVNVYLVYFYNNAMQLLFWTLQLNMISVFQLQTHTENMRTHWWTYIVPKYDGKKDI